MNKTMQRNKQNANARWYVAFALLLTTAATVGCGHPVAYHFKHYHRPFAAIAESNKTYFHSPHTGRIIPKEECGVYCEPGCYGYEPTSWTRWPSECPGNFPVQGEVISEVPVGAAVYEREITPDTPQQPSAPQEQVMPEPPPAESATPQVPSIPADVESSVPSPSDASQHLPSESATPPEPRDASAELNAKRQAGDFVLPRTEIQPPETVVRKVLPSHNRVTRVETNPPAPHAPVVTRLKPDFAQAIANRQSKPAKMSPEPRPVPLKSSSSVTIKSVSMPTASSITVEMPTPRKETPAIRKLTTLVTEKPMRLPAVDRPEAEIVEPENPMPDETKPKKAEGMKAETKKAETKKAETKKATQQLAVTQAAITTEVAAAGSKSAQAKPKRSARNQGDAVIRVSDPGNRSEIRFTNRPSRKANRMTAVVNQQTMIRFKRR